MPCCSPPADPGLSDAVRARLLAGLRGAFGPGAPRRPLRIGAEAELIPVWADTGAPVPILDLDGPCSLALLRSHGARAGWVEAQGPHGAPVFRPPQGGVISYEPGGQIEYSSAPCATVGHLVEALHAVTIPLRRSAEEQGIRLLSVGIDPRNPVEAAPLQLGGPRYACMAAALALHGPAGARMMRQTASLQVNLDWDGDAYGEWRLLQRAAPYLLALFANSPLYAGEATGARSYRARVWRELEPRRTGLLPEHGEPAERYLEFALAAPALLKRTPDGAVTPFAAWLTRGEATPLDWSVHLSTLFPEVRPKGFAEVRSLDAVEPEWYAAPITLLAGLVHSPAARAEAAALLDPPDAALLARAGEEGMSDPTIAGRAAELFRIGLAGATALPRLVDGASLECAQEFYRRYTLPGRAPADEALKGA